jgi:hypothetical protein
LQEIQEVLDVKEQDEKLPITHNEDTEFSLKAADEDDLEARERAEEAEDRQEK